MKIRIEHNDFDLIAVKQSGKDEFSVLVRSPGGMDMRLYAYRGVDLEVNGTRYRTGSAEDLDYAYRRIETELALENLSG